MLVKTKHFGDIDLDDSKILTFDDGILGFENCRKYTILYNNENGSRPAISWLQSLDVKELALPIINPLLAKPDYNPMLEDELLKPLGTLNDDNLMIFLSLTIPADITKMTTNLKAPFIINTDTKKGAQVIVENQDYLIKYPVYEIFKSKEQEA